MPATWNLEPELPGLPRIKPNADGQKLLSAPYSELRTQALARGAASYAKSAAAAGYAEDIQ